MHSSTVCAGETVEGWELMIAVTGASLEDLSRSDHLAGEVALGEDADEVFSVDDGERSDSFLSHHGDGVVNGR